MYLVYGKSFRLIDEKVSEITKNNKNIITMDLNTNELEDVLTEAGYVSMFNEVKYLVVKNSYIFTSKKVKDSDIELFLEYIEHPIENTKIIFTCYDNIDSRKKIVKKFKEKYQIINTDIVKRDDLIYKIREYVRYNKFKIETEAINYLINSCFSNYDLIYNELNKIFLYYNEPCLILEKDVINIAAKSLNDNNFKFVESVVNKNLINALKILEDLYILKVDPITLLLLLAREYRLILSVKIYTRNGFYKDTISKELAMQDWQVDKILKEATLYGEDELKKYLKTIAEIDYKIKSGIIDKFMGLKMFLLNID